MSGVSLYETGDYAWTEEQAAALRRPAAQRSNVPIDPLNLADPLYDCCAGPQIKAACPTLAKAPGP